MRHFIVMGFVIIAYALLMLAAGYDGMAITEKHRAIEKTYNIACYDMKKAYLARQYAYSQYNLDWETYKKPNDSNS